jgi:hypothetical protein
MNEPVPLEWVTSFVQTQAPEQGPARDTLGNAEFPEIEPAPGRYVKVRTN